MKLKEYAEHIAALAKRFPEADTVYGIDFEGNEFRKVEFAPTVGVFDEGSREYVVESAAEGRKVNACCVN